MHNDYNIVSFEDAKRSVRGRFVSNNAKSPGLPVPSGSSGVSVKSAGVHGKASVSGGIGVRNRDNAPGKSGARNAASVAGDKSAMHSKAGVYSKSSRVSSGRSKQSQQMDEDEAQSVAPKLSRKEAKKRARNKAKAERAFNKIYGEDNASSKGIGGRFSRKSNNAAASDSAGPRAAVYKGEMGAKHRKAAAMQSRGAGSRLAFHLPFSFGRSKSQSDSHDEQKLHSGFSSRKMGRAGKIALRAGVSVACLVVFCAAIYAPAQQCYVQIRERDRLAAEYEAVVQRNNILTNNVETLQSNAGVEDLAHSSFGLVKEGENAGSVAGVDIKDKSTFTAKIIPGSVPAPDTWYSDTLDWLFGYSG